MRLFYLTTTVVDLRLLKALEELGHALETRHVDDGEPMERAEGVILDLATPSVDWAERMTAIAPAAFHVQVVGQSEPADAIAALRAGADACFTRPLEVREIAGRLESAARRGRSETPGVRFTLRDRRLVIEGEAIALTRRQYLVAEILTRPLGQVLTAEEIGERMGADVAPAAVRAIISRLNARAGWRLIRGERGRGYRFEPAPTPGLREGKA